jgi:hypothetical protein
METNTINTVILSLNYWSVFSHILCNKPKISRKNHRKETTEKNKASILCFFEKEWLRWIKSYQKQPNNF